MTYQKIFDEIIGEPPVSTVDVERVVVRQRRARRLRMGAAGAGAAAAVLAVVVGTTSLVGTPHAADPAPPAATASPSPTITTVAGTEDDRRRIDAEIATAFVREAPDLRWVKSSGHPPQASPAAVWRSELDRASWVSDTGESGQLDPADGYHGQGNILLGGKSLGHVSVQITRDGAPVWKLTSGRSCPKPGTVPWQCQERTGPAGEKIYVRTSERQEDKPVKRRYQTIGATVLRTDGSLVIVALTVTSVGESASAPVTVDQLLAVALEPAIALAPTR